MSATAGDVIDSVCDRLEESRTGPIFWSRAELLVLLNEGYLELQLITGLLISERTYTMIGAKQQAVPDGAIALLHVAYTNLAIEKSSIELFDRENANWDAQSGILQKWAPMGLEHWFCDRHPAASIAVKLTTLDIPTTLTESTTIDIEQEYVEALIAYTFHGARFKEAGAELQQAMSAYDEYLSIAGIRMKDTIAEQFTAWMRDPDADTGEGYSTLDRN